MIWGYLISEWVILAIVKLLYIRSKCKINKNTKYPAKHSPISEETVSIPSVEQN